MSTPVLILGESGSGKSAAYRNMNPDTTLLIQAIKKPLPFKNKEWKLFNKEAKSGNIVVTDNALDIMNLMKATKRKKIIVDDFQYVLADELMRRYQEKGYDKFSEIGYNGWALCGLASALPDDVRVYILGHTQTDENGITKIKTPGKLLETHSVEGMFSIVMRCITRDGEHYFTTKNNGQDTVKTPMGMFEENLISNDLEMVDKAICNYYEIA